MRFRVSYIASIPDEDLIEAGIDLNDEAEIQEYFWEMGGEESFHDHGEDFEILR